MTIRRLVLCISAVLVFAVTTPANAQSCIQIKCKADQSGCEATFYGGSGTRPCCCTPTCGIGGCSCLNYAYKTCSAGQCRQCECSPGGCNSPSQSDLSATPDGFSVTPELLRTAESKDEIAALVLTTLSRRGTVPVASQFVTGGYTSSRSNPIQQSYTYAVQISADPVSIVMDFHFTANDGSQAPDDIRFELTSAGTVNFSSVPSPAEDAIARFVTDQCQQQIASQ